MNEIINTFLLIEDKFMPQMPLRHPELTYSAWNHVSVAYKFFGKRPLGGKKVIMAN